MTSSAPAMPAVVRGRVIDARLKYSVDVLTPIGLISVWQGASYDAALLAAAVWDRSSRRTSHLRQAEVSQ